MGQVQEWWHSRLQTAHWCLALQQVLRHSCWMWTAAASCLLLRKHERASAVRVWWKQWRLEGVCLWSESSAYRKIEMFGDWKCSSSMTIAGLEGSLEEFPCGIWMEIEMGETENTRLTWWRSAIATGVLHRKDSNCASSRCNCTSCAVAAHGGSACCKGSQLCGSRGWSLWCTAWQQKVYTQLGVIARSDLQMMSPGEDV